MTFEEAKKLPDATKTPTETSKVLIRSSIGNYYWIWKEYLESGKFDIDISERENKSLN